MYLKFIKFYTDSVGVTRLYFSAVNTIKDETAELFIFEDMI